MLSEGANGGGGGGGGGLGGEGHTEGGYGYPHSTKKRVTRGDVNKAAEKAAVEAGRVDLGFLWRRCNIQAYSSAAAFMDDVRTIESQCRLSASEGGVEAVQILGLAGRIVEAAATAIQGRLEDEGRLSSGGHGGHGGVSGVNKHSHFLDTVQATTGAVTMVGTKCVTAFPFKVYVKPLGL